MSIPLRLAQQPVMVRRIGEELHGGRVGTWARSTWERKRHGLERLQRDSTALVEFDPSEGAHPLALEAN